MNFVEGTRKQLEDRLAEIQPILDEGEQIKALLQTMDDVAAGSFYPGDTRKRMSLESRNYQVLSFVHNHEPARNRDLVRALNLTSGRITQLLGKLEADGLVERTGRELRLTSAGRRSIFEAEKPKGVRFDD